jgi:hypothetical protein
MIGCTPRTLRVDYRPHANERTQGYERKLMRKIGFAPWVGYPCIDDPNQDTETFAEQKARLGWILALPDDELDM